jgi:5-methyltetrahydrofolate--homocysteine methyltransferase
MNWLAWFPEWPVIADGAWGTELQGKELSPGECPDGWNLSHPAQVAAVAQMYRAAGSAVILTNTFRSNRVSLAGFGLADRVKEINVAGARLSKRAGGARVFGSMGPTGKLVAAAEITHEEVFEAFQEQAWALAEGGVDALLIETMSDREEAVIAVRAAKTTGLPVILSFAFDSGKNKDRTMTGVSPEQAVKTAVEAGADAVGANCGAGIEQFPGVCGRMRAVTELPLWMKANAGLPEMDGGRIVYRTSPAAFAGMVPQLIEAGAHFVGGCCGTGPEFIRAIRSRLLYAA